MIEKAGEVTLSGFSYYFEASVIMNKFERIVTACTASFRQKDGNNLLKTSDKDNRETYQYATQGTCSKEILIELEGDIVRHVEFIGGCPGGLAAIGELISEMKIDEVKVKVKAIPCRNGTSCGDQLSKALGQIQDIRKHTVTDDTSFKVFQNNMQTLNYHAMPIKGVKNQQHLYVILQIRMLHFTIPLNRQNTKGH